MYQDHEIQTYLGRLHVLLAKGHFKHARDVIDLAETELPNQFDYDGLLVDQSVEWALEYAFWENGTISEHHSRLASCLQIVGFEYLRDILPVNKKTLLELPGISIGGCNIIEQMFHRLGFVWPIVLINDRPCADVVSRQKALAWQNLGVLTMREAEKRGLIES